MATPNRLKSDRLQSVIGPFVKLAKIITPTGVGVLLSVGAHAALIAAGPRLNVSFDSLTKENLAANPEETIVPILQLSPAERNRLPNFAQPRRPPTSTDLTTGLSSLPLPSGLPSLPSNRATTRRPPIPSRPIPSPSLSRPRALPRIGQSIPNRTTQPAPFRLNFPIGTAGLPTPTPAPTPAGTPYIADTPPEPELNSGEGATPVRRIDENGIPILEPNASEGSVASGSNENSTDAESSASSGGISLSDVLSGTDSASIAVNPSDDDPTNGEAIANPTEPGESDVTPIPVDNTEDVIASAPAEGNPAKLLQGSSVYSEVGVSDSEAQENLQAWLTRTAERTGAIETGTKEISIDSGFKACREVAPADGLIGVLVNPDGTRESVEMLKSTGYGSLNSLALTTLEYEDFGTPEIPTQYQVAVDVIYAPEDCVDDLPEEASAEAPE